jgi:dimethylhistidine N-methyltransferase
MDVQSICIARRFVRNAAVPYPQNIPQLFPHAFPLAVHGDSAGERRRLMMPKTITFYDYKPDTGRFMDDVLQGLGQSQKTLSCKYFYDQRGSELFDEICELPEYYSTRTELAILESAIHELTALVPGDGSIIEFGSGGSRKIRLLLDGFRKKQKYVPIDISGEHLLESSKELQNDYPALEVIPVCADYTKPFTLPDEIQNDPNRLVFFPGSTIGNFEPEKARVLLRLMRQAAGERGKILIGVDLVKDVNILHQAYNDSLGVTADFNKNLLVRMNRELDSNFNLDTFRHEACFNEDESRIEMHLVSLCDQTVTVCGTEFHFKQGETIFTESSYKYTVESFTQLAGQEGFVIEKTWTDEQNWFSVHLLGM